MLTMAKANAVVVLGESNVLLVEVRVAGLKDLKASLGRHGTSESALLTRLAPHHWPSGQKRPRQQSTAAKIAGLNGLKASLGRHGTLQSDLPYVLDAASMAIRLEETSSATRRQPRSQV
ncbi:MAG: hypothetical protein M1816_007250 [Peltula sp. TS41687]|nr:MAG: hypothetical protein M1816_007250 [Peltula sp. TS41687]